MSCNENSLSPDCTCSSKYQPGTSTKIFTFANGGEYICCGTIAYNMAQQVTTGGSLVQAAAATDNPACTGWWQTSVDPATTAAVAGAGPSTNKVAAIQNTFNVSNAIPPANIIAGLNTASTFDCTDVVSNVTNLETFPRLLSFLNPNGVGDTYSEIVACVPENHLLGGTPYDWITGTQLDATGNFAVYDISGCDTTLATCAPPGGLTDVVAGTQVYATQDYNGNNPNPPNNGTPWWVWLIVGIVALIIVIAIIVLLVWAFSSSGKPTSQPVKYVQAPAPTPAVAPQPQIYYTSPPPALPPPPAAIPVVVTPAPAPAPTPVVVTPPAAAPPPAPTSVVVVRTTERASAPAPAVVTTTQYSTSDIAASNVLYGNTLSDLS